MASDLPYDVSLKIGGKKSTSFFSCCTALVEVENQSGAIFMWIVARITQSLSYIHQCDN